MMTKIRAAQSLGSALCGKSHHKRGYELYKKTAKEILNEGTARYFSDEHLDILQEALDASENMSNEQEKAWQLRSAIDTVYDNCINELNDVDSQRPPAFQIQIKDCINEASPYVNAGNYHEGLSKYTTLLKRFQNNIHFKKAISNDTLAMVAQVLNAVIHGDDLQYSVKKARESLDRLYNEIRLPDVYYPSSGPQVHGYVFTSQFFKKASSSVLIVEALLGLSNI